MSPRILYVSFDVVPAPKGAATHIEQFTKALSAKYGSLNLVTVADSDLAGCRPASFCPEIEHTTLPALGDNLISRVLHFRRLLNCWVAGKFFDVLHFRSPFEGLWLAAQKANVCRRLVYEVNGLPSIELKYRYPRVAEDNVLMDKLIAQEQFCMDLADSIITPSAVTKEFLIQRGVAGEKIAVIPNGVSLEVFTFSSPKLIEPDKSIELLYFGTLAAWQGVQQAIKAHALVARDAASRLTIVGSARDNQLDEFRELIHDMGLDDTVRILPPVSQLELLELMHQSNIILAPLTANDRNCLQGCSPLKVFEGMASGTPVITSDLPVVTELPGVNKIDGQTDCLLLAKAGSAKTIKDRIFELKDSPLRAIDVASNARRLIENYYTWERAGSQLVDVYDDVLSNREKIFSR